MPATHTGLQSVPRQFSELDQPPQGFATDRLIGLGLDRVQSTGRRHPALGAPDGPSGQALLAFRGYPLARHAPMIAPPHPEPEAVPFVRLLNSKQMYVE